MQYRTLGRTGLEVSHLAFGGLFVASFSAEYEQAKQAVHRAFELGINYFDTAPTYGNSEEVLGKALAGVTKPFILSTKLGGRPMPFDPRDKDGLLRSIEESDQHHVTTAIGHFRHCHAMPRCAEGYRRVNSRH